MTRTAATADGQMRPMSPWLDTTPVREELFGVERLEQHAHSLASAQRITDPVRQPFSRCTKD